MNFPFRFLVIILFLTILCSTSSLADISKDEKNTTIQALSDGGFLVEEGKMQVTDAIGLYDAGITPSCYAINPSTPYMQIKLPKAPGQTSNNTISDAPINPENAGLWLDYHMRPDEAIVYIGITPPECDYFSYTSYLAGRHYPPQERITRLYGSLGDSLSLSRLQKEPAYQSKVFSQPIIIIFTGDTNANAKVRESLLKAGYPEDIMHTMIIPNEIFRFGLEEQTDTFTNLHRFAFFHNQTEGDAYVNSSPGMVFRLTPKIEEKPNYYPVPTLIPRGNGDTRELDLTKDLEQLRQAIVARYGADHVTDLTTKVWIFEGYDAIQRGIDALGEIRDTVYLNTTDTILGDKPGECIIVYGVNHAVTGKATYSNFGLYSEKALNGIGGVSNHDFTGTAEEFLPDNPNAKYLYVAKISRGDDGKKTTAVIGSGMGAHGIDPDQPCFVGFRAYVEPETGVSPAWSEIVYDRAMKIDP
jgi:hypothetical protein